MRSLVVCTSPLRLATRKACPRSFLGCSLSIRLTLELGRPVATVSRDRGFSPVSSICEDCLLLLLAVLKNKVESNVTAT